MNNIKKVSILFLSLIALASMTNVYAGSGHSHHHGDKDKDKDKDHHHHDHDKDAHIAKKVGPNGGRIITKTETHFEFFVAESGQVQITFLNESGDAIPAAEQTISLIGGSRSKPTQLKFSKKEDLLVSDKALPTKGSIPVILQIREKAGAKPIREKFNLNMNDCSSCPQKEYACVCMHSHDKDKDKDHHHHH